MNNINLTIIPTSEIIFYLMHCGLDKDIANVTLTKRLGSYGLNEDEIVDLLAREIIKIKTRGANIDDYCFRKNKSIEELLKIGFLAVSRTDNFNNLTVSEIIILQDIIRILNEKYYNFIETIIKSDVLDKSYILPIATNVSEHLELLYKILRDIQNEEYNVIGTSFKDSLIQSIKDCFIMEISATKPYYKSLENREKLDRTMIFADEKLINTYCPRLR